MTYSTILFLVIFFRCYSTKKTSFLDYDYIESVNKLATTWKVSMEEVNVYLTDIFMQQKIYTLTAVPKYHFSLVHQRSFLL